MAKSRKRKYLGTKKRGNRNYRHKLASKKRLNRGRKFGSRKRVKRYQRGGSTGEKVIASSLVALVSAKNGISTVGRALRGVGRRVFKFKRREPMGSIFTGVDPDMKFYIECDDAFFNLIHKLTPIDDEGRSIRIGLI